MYFVHNKENNIRNIFGTLMFQQLLVNKHHRLRDFKAPTTIWPSGGLRLVIDKKKIIKIINPVQSKNRARPMAARLINTNEVKIICFTALYRHFIVSLCLSCIS